MVKRERTNEQQNLDEQSIQNAVQYTKKHLQIPNDIIFHELENPILKNFMLTWTGYYKNALGHRLDKRIYSYEYCMLYCIDGCGWFSMNGNTWDINTGDVFFQFTNIEHSYGSDSQNPWSIYWICFTGESAPYYLNALNVTPDNPVLHIGKRSNVITEFNDIFNTLSDGYGHIQLLHSSSCTRQILTSIIKDQIDLNDDTLNGISIKKIINYMQSNIGKKLSLDELSSYSNLSKYYFIHKFKEKTGYTPSDYFSRLKIQKASELLIGSLMNVNEISEFLGYDNYCYFSLVFKKIIGCSPQQYRIKQK
jgi:AraC family transcriptional regulator of arabinose operon